MADFNVFEVPENARKIKTEAGVVSDDFFIQVKPNVKQENERGQAGDEPVTNDKNQMMEVIEEIKPEPLPVYVQKLHFEKLNEGEKKELVAISKEVTKRSGIWEKRAQLATERIGLKFSADEFKRALKRVKSITRKTRKQVGKAVTGSESIRLVVNISFKFDIFNKVT